MLQKVIIWAVSIIGLIPQEATFAYLSENPT